MRITRNKTRMVSLFLLVALVFGIWAYLHRPRSILDYGNPATARMKIIGLVIQDYYETYGELPGTSEGQISEALRGGTSDGKPFFDDQAYNNEGLLIDAYGSSLEISITSPTISLRSAGRNRVRGDDDDLLVEVLLEEPPRR